MIFIINSFVFFSFVLLILFILSYFWWFFDVLEKLIDGVSVYVKGGVFILIVINIDIVKFFRIFNMVVISKVIDVILIDIIVV